MTPRYASTYSSVEAVRPMRVLDLFSAAAGGWSLGMHRAGFITIAACEVVEWRRILYAENNPGVHLYDDIRTLTADRIVSDLGYLPDIIVGSPPCQDISSANTKGKGIEGERSGLYLDAIRLVGECRPRWFAFENSANLRTRGADAVLAELEELGYACWPFVVRASDIGANHERARSWIIGCDADQVVHTTCLGHEGRRARGHGADGHGEAYAPHSHENREPASSLNVEMADSGTVAGNCQSGSAAHGDEAGRGKDWGAGGAEHVGSPSRKAADRALCRQPDGRASQGFDGGQMGLCPADSEPAGGCWPQWSLENLADSLRLDDGLSAWVADTRIATGSGKRTSAAILIVEAFGDAVVPQIPEAIGRAILRVEAALSAVSPPSPTSNHREGAL